MLFPRDRSYPPLVRRPRVTIVSRRSPQLPGRSSHNHHVGLTLEQEETIAEFQGETCLRPVGIFIDPAHGDLLCILFDKQFHGGEHLRKSTRRVTFRMGAENVIIAVHGPRLGR